MPVAGRRERHGLVKSYSNNSQHFNFSGSGVITEKKLKELVAVVVLVVVK